MTRGDHYKRKFVGLKLEAFWLLPRKNHAGVCGFYSPRKPHVFIHIESNDMLKGQLSCVMKFNQFSVYTYRRRPSRESENKRSISCRGILQNPLSNIMCFGQAKEKKIRSGRSRRAFAVELPGEGDTCYHLPT